ncbi:MAG TPA: symmetrical bis(5'-nucleosyl)-tetraphosphatase [Accumulibacter sp.]|uniref:symmetrical bis(5'-nucleosyl)-tetraphosphatase n=1 Tax=Accumulibacter sp. TaxID=2053492 RepID=UPI0025FE74D8|nr:symmetrical bis(5'-nucleosyl)-tetraphosphatase [Accumulibacter sp.]MCM8599654.1 symmetrical bis(5'-nucleosyl)-tetraphosphatase [Accumulibacter sp.]MCM8663313.1 symmetrical bis(5'-nucleosyl)-tetraphosphatase [Accumulibacter sp.]HNC50713.1 symmetrical bis(5'-nucleosyl)-tetraphosphatase [Accumulibacter sp.]
MATYAIGDIQGCFDSFRRLLEKCRFDPAYDRLWLVGDLVNRGPRSLDTLRFVRELGPAAVIVLGNHELYLLMAAAGFGRRSKGDTLDQIFTAPDCDILLDWLRRQPLCYSEGEFCLVHAGLLPQWTVPKARALAAEVESVLAGHAYGDFLANMWGSEPAAWSDDLEGWPRLRVIVNAMTRMRFCSPTGVMEFRTKGEASAAPPGHLPWFEVPGRLSADHVLVIGHWSALGLRIEAGLLALDSGCYWGRHLTAVRLEDRAVFQIDCATGYARA